MLLKAFLPGQHVFALLWTDFGNSLDKGLVCEIL